MIDNPQVGDRIRLTAEIGGPKGNVGDTGTIEALTGSYGGLKVRMDGDTTGGAYDGGVYSASASQMVRIESAAASTPPPFEVGVRVELTRAYGGAPVGTKGVLTRTCCAGLDAWFKVEGLGETEHRVEFSYLRTLLPETPAAPESSTVAEFRARQERAERELQEFKDTVHRRVCEISDERQWCTDADAWLESLGLPPREEPEVDYAELGVPQSRYAVVRLSNGALVVRKDDDDEPWHVIEGSYSGMSYLSDQDVHESSYVTLFDGADYY